MLAIPLLTKKYETLVKKLRWNKENFKLCVKYWTLVLMIYLSIFYFITRADGNRNFKRSVNKLWNFGIFVILQE